MRNEHIVRAHQTPIFATNPNNGNQPWRVIHVNNAATPVGNGTAESPFTTIKLANAAATNPWDIVLVAKGSSSVNLTAASPTFGTVTNAYDGTFSPLAANQYFIGEGSPFYIPTVSCGNVNIGGTGGIRPVLSNPTGASINLSKGLQANNFDIVNSAVGISGSGNMTGTGGRPSLARDIDIYRTDPTATGRGIEISGATGAAVFRDVNIGKVVTIPGGKLNWTMTDGSVVVTGGAPVVDFANGSIVNTQNHILQVADTLGGGVVLTANPSQPFTETGDGILVSNAAGDVTVKNKTPGMPAANITSQENGIAVFNSSGTQTFDDINILGAGLSGGAGFAGVNLQGNSGTSNFNNLAITTVDSTGFLAVNDNAVNVTGNSTVDSTGAPAVVTDNIADANINFRTINSKNSFAEGVYLNRTNGDFTVSNGLTVTDPTTHGLRIENSASLAVNVPATVTIDKAGIDGIRLINNNQTSGKTMVFDDINVTTGDQAANPPVLGGRGVVIQATTVAPHGKVTISDGLVNAFGGESLDINNADVAITLTSAASAASSANGLNLINTKGSVTIGQTFVQSPTGNGLNLVDNVPGFVADFGTAAITGIVNGAIGVNITNTIDPTPDTFTTFDSVKITTENGTGLKTVNGGTVNFNTPAVIIANKGPAIDLENTTGTTNNVLGSGFTFRDLSSIGSATNGVRLHNLNSNLRATGTTNINNAAGPSILITDDQTPRGDDVVVFDQVSIVGRFNTGVLVEGTYGEVKFTSLSDGGPAAGGTGPSVRVFNTTNPADPIGPGSGQVSVLGGNLAAGGNAFEVENGLANILNTTIASTSANAVYVTAGTGQYSTVLVQGTNLTAGIDGVRTEASGTGQINATVFTSQIVSGNDSIGTIVYSAGADTSLNASGNFGTAGPPVGPINLANIGGGLLIIDQSSLGNLSTANNAATVVNTGAVTFGGSTPTPPPPTP